MQDHDFEKQVHLKMEEMKILPSEDVWEKVELRLHQKDRRRWIIWLPLLLAGLSLTGYWVSNKFHTPTKKHSAALANTPKTKQLHNDKNSSSIKNNEITDVDNKTETAIFNKNQQAAIINTDHKNTLNKIIKNHQKNTDAGEQPDNQPIHKKSIAGSYPDNPYKLWSNKKSQHPIAQPEILPSPKHIVPEITQPENKTAISDITEQDLLVQQQEAINELFPIIVKDVPIPVNTINTSLLIVQKDLNKKILTKLHETNRSWQWGLSIQAGRSSIASGSLDKLFGGTQSDFFAMSPPSQPNNNISPSAVYKEPSPLKPATGFSAGVFVKKQLSQKFAVSIGLNYTLYSTTNLVGLKIDSSLTLQNSFASNRLSLDQFYRVGNTGRHTNTYHFIELPVFLQTRLIRSRKMPLYWDLGFSVSKLLKSNALSFDYVSGVYYKDNQQLNKTQFNFITGLPVRLFSTRKLALQTGPEFRYGLSNVVKPETTTGKHFLFLGLKANLLFGNK
ncbi:MAG: porin family protein [Chitinophagaceae bacterium]